MIIATSSEQYVFIFPHGNKWCIPCSSVLTIIMWLKKIITGEACHNKIHSPLKFMIIVLNNQTITYLYGWRFQTVYEGKILKVIWVPFTFFLLLKFCWRPFVWLTGKMMNKCRLESELVIKFNAIWLLQNKTAFSKSP